MFKFMSLKTLCMASLSPLSPTILSGPDLDELPGLVRGVHLSGHVVEQNPGNHHGGPQPGERRDLDFKHEHRAPDERRPLAGFCHAVGDRADVVHEVEGGEGLRVRNCPEVEVSVVQSTKRNIIGSVTVNLATLV